MSSGQNQRTPRYWPRMKVRGARRKRQRTMYLFQRIGDGAWVSGLALNAFGAALIDVQRALDSHVCSIEKCGPRVGAYDLADLGTSIMKEAHGSDS